MGMKINSVLGPTAKFLTLEDLPSPNTGRWVPRRKAEVVHAVRGGLLTREEAKQRYNLSEAEYREWDKHYADHGLPGLRTTKQQEYR